MRRAVAALLALVVATVVTPVRADVMARSDVQLRIKVTDVDAKTKKPVHAQALCSGVYVGNRLIATAAHCVTEGKVDSITVTLDVDGREYGKFTAHSLLHSAKADVALLQVDAALPAQAAELACREPVIGESLEMVGNPLGQFFVHTWGRVAGVLRDLQPDGQNPDGKLIPIDVAIAPGNSGGPVYDKDGKVLGLADMMIAAGDGSGSHVNFMVSSLALCGAPGIPTAVASAGPGGSTDE